MQKLLAVALGGSLGALLRVGLISLTAPLEGDALLAGALTANLLGCFAIGLLWEHAKALPFTPELQAFAFAGVIGSLTTFSTFGLVSTQLFLDGAHIQGIAYVLGSNLVGLLFVYVGLLLGSRYLNSTRSPSSPPTG